MHVRCPRRTPATAHDLCRQRMPVSLGRLALLEATLALEVGTEHQAGIEDDVVSELRIAHDPDQVKLSQR